MPNRIKGKGKTQSEGRNKGKGRAKNAPYSGPSNSLEDIIPQTQEWQQESLQAFLALEASTEKEPPEELRSKGKEVIYAFQEDVQVSTPPPPSPPAATTEEADTLTEPKRDKGKQKAVFEAESSSSSPMPDSDSDEYASSSEYEHDWMSDYDDEAMLTEAGIFEVGVSEAGPSEVGPSVSGPSAAGPSEAGPSSQPHKRQKRDTPVQPPDPQRHQQQKFYAYSWDVQLDYPGSSPICNCLAPPSHRQLRQQEPRFLIQQETFYLELNRVLGHLNPLFTTIEAATPSPASRAQPLTNPYPLYRACIRSDESGILELVHGDWISSIPEALRSLYNVLQVAPTRFKGNWPIGPEEFGCFRGCCSGCGKQRERRGERRWWQVIVQAFYAEEPERNWRRGVEGVGVRWGD